MTSPVTWPVGGNFSDYVILPTSRCSEPCPVGHVTNIQQGDLCCWVCTPCQLWQVVDNGVTTGTETGYRTKTGSGSTCVDCPFGSWPSEDRSTCHVLEVQRVDWSSAYTLVPAYLAGVGMALTFVVMVTFMRNLATPIVMASGRELSFMLLVGFLICYVMTFILLAQPNPALCAVQRFGLTFGFAVIYASLLMKTNRISRIFDSARLSAKRPPCISPRSQVTIACILIGVQVAYNTLWLVIEPPDTHLITPGDKREPFIVVQCKYSLSYFIGSLTYSVALIACCTLYAIKTRNIPENFNESKFIGFTMYTTCIIWLAFLPIYVSTSHAIQVRSDCM